MCDIHNHRSVFSFPFLRSQLTWFDGDDNEIEEGVRETVELLSDGKRFTVKSTLKFQAKSEHHNTTFTCRAKSAADKTAKKAEIKIEVIGLKRVCFSYIYTFDLRASLLDNSMFELHSLLGFRRVYTQCVLANRSIMI